MAGNDLNVKVDANTSGFEAAIARAERATLSYDSALGRLAGSIAAAEKQLDDEIAAALERQHAAMTRTGQGMFVFGAAVAAGLGMATNEAMKWESAWTGVTKTVEGSPEQMAALEQQLRALTQVLPATHEEIAGVAEAAGQLGVQRDQVAAFTKTMIDLGETTNLSADEAATGLARFSAIMGTSQDDADRLGSVIVGLGNNFQTTEAEILAMAQRIAGAGAQLNLTEGDVMGVAAALSSVGIEAEAGGSAISTVMKDIQTEVSTGGEKLDQFARVAGMSGEEFARLWGEDAAAALNAFVTGLGGIKAQGGDVIGVLTQMGITQIRQSDALLRLAGAGDLLTRSLETGNEAWAENSALIEEANKRYATSEARVELARNAMRDAAIDVGAVLLPALASVAETLANLITAWGDLPGPLRTGITLLAAAASAAALLGGAALIAVPKIAAFQTAVAGLEAGALKSAGTRLAALGSFMMGPWGLALAGATAAVGLFAAEQGEATRRAEAFRGTLDTQTGAITAMTREMAVMNLQESGWLEWAREADVSMELVVDAMINGGSAMEEFKQQVSEGGISARAFGSDAAQFSKAVQDQRAAILDAQDAQRLLNDANEAGAAATDDATDSADTFAGTLGDVGDTAGETAEEIKTLGEELEELSENYLSNRDAGRAVRASLRDIREATRAYREENGNLKGAFKDGTRSGDEFAGMLDDLARDYQRQISTVERLTGSEERIQAAYDRSRAKLVQVAEQLGMTEKQAERYADRVLSTPEQVRTRFVADTAAASAQVDQFISSVTDRTIGIGVRVLNPPALPFPLAPQANGGIVQAFADGGFAADGSYVDRVPQIASGRGPIVWGEPVTGWEAYISGKPGMESRNREIWLEAGRRLGMVAGSFDRGGFAGAAPAAAAGGPQEIRGVLSIPGLGEGFIRGVVRSELDADRSFDATLAGRKF